MTSPLPAQIRANPGSPASVRIGVVVSLSPLVVDVQGALFTNLGRLTSYTPAVGHVVVVLGQSSSSSVDPTSWVVIGNVVAA